MSRWATALSAISLFLWASSGATADVPADDPASRGLDAFVHMPESAPSGGSLPLEVAAVGFPTVTSVRPLPGAVIEATWNPKSLGVHTSVAPPAVRVVADSAGRAHLEIAVPRGDQRNLELLVSVRTENHERTRTFPIKRRLSEQLSLYVSDTKVVPGGAVFAWAIVRGASTGQPLPGAPITFDLLEGGFPRFTTRAVSDAGGSAMARVPIPESEDPGMTWRLRASTTRSPGEEQSTETVLTPRDETPAKPGIALDWRTSAVVAGDKAKFRATIHDASGEPVAGLVVRYWIGPDGTTPPEERSEWEKDSKPAVTDLGGSISATTDTPSTITPLGTKMTVVVQTTVSGHPVRASADLAVGPLAPTLAVIPELGVVIPGVDQRLALRVLDAHHHALRGSFAITGDGLDQRVTTDERGNAEIAWKAPRDLGARRDRGPCAGEVAAAVLVRALDTTAFASHPEPYELCVRIDRDASVLIRPDHPFARAGQPVHVDFVRGSEMPWSVVMRGTEGGPVVTGFAGDGQRGIDLRLPVDARGIWTISAVSPGREDSPQAATVLALPRTLPKLVAKMSAGRAAPGGTVVVDADLVDETGHGLAGTVASLMIDLQGGGNAHALEDLDTRRALTAPLFTTAFDQGFDSNALLLGDSSYDTVRRALLAGQTRESTPATSDPERDAKKTMEIAFRQVVKSLEGAVLEASISPEGMKDARRRAPRGFDFNPELMTLVTAAMTEKPLTPGGEPILLGDLMAVDPQISFDRVARRVTRFKLFRILSAVRTFIREHRLDLDEPVFKDPNALLRRLSREGTLAEGSLLDPWGHTIQFVPSNGPRVPFLTVRGFELRAPGPDGALGSTDDVKSPFERVLRSGTPYADAVAEDRLVDARWDMEVGEATVSAWDSLLQEVTGQGLGDGFGTGIGLGSIGEGGGGQGEGHASHGATRITRGIDLGNAHWSPPVRTDANGHIQIRVPLGDIETTWRLTLIGIPDHASPAITALDIQVELPLSVHIDTGMRWTEGDEIGVGLTLRNRTDRPLHASLTARPGGVVALVGQTGKLAVDVPARGAVTRTVAVRASSAGSATLDVATSALGVDDDVVHHAWDVRPAGETIVLSRTAWIKKESSLAVPNDPEHVVFAGPPSLVLEQSHDASLGAALSSLEPDRLKSAPAVLDALETATRIARWATARGGDQDPLAVRADRVASRAAGRFTALIETGEPGVKFWPTSGRAAFYLQRVAVETAPCPGDANVPFDVWLAGLEAEPPAGSSVAACWESFVGSALQQISPMADPLVVARAVLAFAERPHRITEAMSLANRLRELVPLRPAGTIVLTEPWASDRAARATILAALLRSARIGTDNSLAIPGLVSAMLVQRDADGGYGSSSATRAVVRALVSVPLASDGIAHVRVKDSQGKMIRELDLASGRTIATALDAATSGLRIEATGAGVLALLSRPALRSWKSPPAALTSPVRVEARWPLSPRRDATGVLKVSLRHTLGREAVIRARLPLPPGVSLAEEVTGVRQVQGALLITTAFTASADPTLIDIPLRFTLAGKVTVPEGVAHLANEDAAIAYAPARPIVVN